MPTVDIKITNLPQIKRAFRQAPQLMTRELDKAIKKSLISIQAETTLNVGGGRGINVITHGLASAANRPPIFTRLKGVYDVDISYAVFVHEGTRFMKGRPFLKNAVESKEQTVQRYFKESVDNVLNDIGKIV